MNAVDLLVEIIQEHSPEDIWRDSPLIGYRMLGNTNRGEIGEEFVRRFLGAHGWTLSAVVAHRKQVSVSGISDLRSKRRRLEPQARSSSTTCVSIVHTTFCSASAFARMK